MVKSAYVSERQYKYKVYPPCFRELMTWDEQFEVKGAKVRVYKLVGGREGAWCER